MSMSATTAANVTTKRYPADRRCPIHPPDQAQG
jgi:hypothetical protein